MKAHSKNHGMDPVKRELSRQAYAALNSGTGLTAILKRLPAEALYERGPPIGIRNQNILILAGPWKLKNVLAASATLRHSYEKGLFKDYRDQPLEEHTFLNPQDFHWSESYQPMREGKLDLGDHPNPNIEKVMEMDALEATTAADLGRFSNSRTLTALILKNATVLHAFNCSSEDAKIRWDRVLNLDEPTRIAYVIAHTLQGVLLEGDPDFAETTEEKRIDLKPLGDWKIQHLIGAGRLYPKLSKIKQGVIASGFIKSDTHCGWRSKEFGTPAATSGTSQLLLFGILKVGGLEKEFSARLALESNVADALKVFEQQLGDEGAEIAEQLFGSFDDSRNGSYIAREDFAEWSAEMVKAWVDDSEWGPVKRYFQKKNYRPRPNYLPVECLYHHQFCAYGEVSFNRWAPHIDQEYGIYATARECLKYDNPVFHVDPDLVEILNRTDLPETTDIWNMPWPFNGFTVVMPLSTKPLFAMFSIAKVTEHEIPETLWTNRRPVYTPAIKMTPGIYCAVIDNKEYSIRAIDYGTGNLIPDENDAASQAMIFAYKLISWLNYSQESLTPPQVLDRETSVTPKAGVGKETLAAYTDENKEWAPYIVGLPHTSEGQGLRALVQESREAAGRKKRFHWRRGHMRNQPHGVGRLLRKTIFIAPYRVGEKDEHQKS